MAWTSDDDLRRGASVSSTAIAGLSDAALRRARCAADQRDRERASHPSVALPALPRADQRRLPELIAASAVGPRLQAAVLTLTARHRISRRGICELAHDMFGVNLSTGAVDAICQRASDALAGPHCQ